MERLSLSEKYAVGAAVALLFMVMLNSAFVMLVLSVIGLGAGLWIARQGAMRRSAVVGLVAFAISLAFALFGLLR